ncbi:mRNA splicing protein [Yamadazyma tenuis]|uniref:Pre-mRNA-splicing factor SLU7 n=1 Tax=Candida tenuis (strain ATCC 10573 / BCRC 21748 / CBS 615 / JCM 9827 / NBRC 10315 / NRRL Y-1498 / VKM Y-70) TaxID=590646 RepID=G3B4S3_CANTC|nr:uncharacterized protein CANTEDRAFT_93364 [Yamadazyma tenuis ATCC 10573]EGV63859.1 hypothetical protein CANTEDRAFT_93364 [Yamadazyma tenuis ATCC 10573]WEJ96528.1 mRNA splicing protein [Yamadazyma tenuis]
MEDNKYIPKFIKQTPWYKEGQSEEVKDHSYSKHGDGFSKDSYDAKRDKWEGYQVDYTKKENSTGLNVNGDDEGDDTDYELELTELGLSRKDIKDNNKQDKHEKLMRSRDDVPSYIKSIKTVQNDNEWEASNKS